jgi:hypothetical protein
MKAIDISYCISVDINNVFMLHRYHLELGKTSEHRSDVCAQTENKMSQYCFDLYAMRKLSKTENNPNFHLT